MRPIYLKRIARGTKSGAGMAAACVVGLAGIVILYGLLGLALLIDGSTQP